MGDIIWGVDFRAKARRLEDETLEQQMVREIMGTMGVLGNVCYPDEPLPCGSFPWRTEPADEPA